MVKDYLVGRCPQWGDEIHFANKISRVNPWHEPRQIVLKPRSPLKSITIIYTATETLKMPKVKPVIAMKQRLERVLCELAEQEEVIELIKQALQKYELQPTDVFSAESLETALAPTLVDESIPYCDRGGNTWSGKGRRPKWLVEAIDAGAAIEDFKNPLYNGN